MKKWGNIIFWVVVLALALFALNTVYSKNKSSGAIPKSSQQSVVAPDFTLQSLDGKNVKLSDLRGKVVVLNFWATWCPYCVQEMPDLNKVNAEITKDGNAIMFAIDEQEKIDIVKKYLSDKDITIPILMDYDGKVGNMYNVSGIPATFIINKDGTVYDVISGATSEQELLKKIKSIK